MTSNRTIQRTAFSTSRLLDFVSEKELTAQIGHARTTWPLVVVKELIDNSLDACEEAGVLPQIRVVVDQDGIAVEDNGPGIPAEVVTGILDFSSRVSSREAYIAPDRGAQGNALKTLIAMPFVLSGQEGRVAISSRGVRHEIRLRVDHIRQRPVLDHQQHPSDDRFVKNGTLVRLHWPNSPSSEVRAGDSIAQDLSDGELQEKAIPDHSPSSLLHRARDRFLQIADDFTFLNPHLTLSIDWHGEISTVESTVSAPAKWLPSQPTCAHWYQPEHFGRLVAAYIAHDADRGQDRTVRELVSEFSGLSATSKQKAVLDVTGMARTGLSELGNSTGLDERRIEALLRAMQTHSRPVKPAALGLIGKDHLGTRLAAVGCEMNSFQYRKALGETNGVPWIFEAAFAWRPGAVGRRLITGVNWSPGILNPFRELGTFGESLDSVLERQRAGQEEPIVLVLHLACPRVAFADRGKSSIVMED